MRGNRCSTSGGQVAGGCNIYDGERGCTMRRGDYGENQGIYIGGGGESR